MKDKFVEDSKEKLTDKGVQGGKSRLIPEGTLLLSYKLSIGKVAITKKPLYTNEAIAALFPKKPINISYLYYYLKQIDFAKYGRKAVKGICLNKEILSKIEIQIIPIEEQNKIVNLLEKAELLQQWRRESDKLTNDYLNSVFLKMFGDPMDNPLKWKMISINNAVEYSQYGTSCKSNSQKKGYPIIGMSNITYEGTLDLLDLSYVEIIKSEFEKLKLHWRRHF